ncbi:hypothetical protein ABE237_23155 [Brevibacillus formosus]|uniref:hypothetical protein n=1 Tax=Brevibacillus TaxID=55080 RepID=UPI000D103F8F|nr:MULTISPECIES: hypothetical protein [Brevibacillus]MBG9940500.1 hypothetical protein [Brevibacillus formosus]MED1944695.1 hypothetical protein [Brevibacillus formosus]MED1996618.1 hypothetical protein [Brevibacillus formosus]MED2081587.1 hypothetical protein [Brevibacillus formosus]PSK12373.1 hypothetical protein C7R94_24270 [Brevibacillus sp. NRRL NRS-603]
MRLSILDEEYIFENTSSAMMQLLEVINAKIKDNDLLVSHLTVNGVEVFSNFESYLNENLSDVEIVVVYTTNSSKLVNEIMLSTEEYVDRAIPQVKSLSEQFYQGATNDTWLAFGEMLEGLQWFQQISLFIQKQALQPELLNFAAETLDFTDELRSLEEAVEQQDVILIGDIILYEILPKFEGISGNIGEINSNEVLDNVVN